jgi:hypothetical protein
MLFGSQPARGGGRGGASPGRGGAPRGDLLQGQGEHQEVHLLDVEHLEVLLVEEHHQLREEELLYHHQPLLQVLLKQLDMTIIVLVVMRATQTLMQEIHTQRLDMQQEVIHSTLIIVMGHPLQLRMMSPMWIIPGMLALQAKLHQQEEVHEDNSVHIRMEQEEGHTKII